jgi:hypothetical protein
MLLTDTGRQEILPTLWLNILNPPSRKYRTLLAVGVLIGIYHNEELARTVRNTNRDEHMDLSVDITRADDGHCDMRRRTGL